MSMLSSLLTQNIDYRLVSLDVELYKRRRLLLVLVFCRCLRNSTPPTVIKETHDARQQRKPTSTIHKMTTTSLAITICGQCCRRHVVGQRVVTDICVVRSCRSICSLCSESNYANFVTTPVHCCTWNVYFNCFTYQTKLDLQHGRVYLVTTDSLVTSQPSLCLIYSYSC